MKDTNYIHIAGWMINRLGLSGSELIVFAIIYGFSQDEYSYFDGSLKYLQLSTGKGRTTVINTLKKLASKGLITKVSTDVNGVIFNKYTSKPGVQKLYGGGTETVLEGVQKLYEGSTETVPNNTIDNTKEEKIEEKQGTLDIYPTFNDFWNLYDKKVGRPQCEKKWSKLSQKEKEQSMDYIPVYIKSQPNKQYRKNPETFLNQKSWNDEIINNGQTGTKGSSNNGNFGDAFKTILER